MSSAAAPPPDKEFMATLAKGLAVLGAFGSERPAMTLSEAAATAGLSRAAARRVLRTLAGLGYITHDGRRFALAPRILELGFAYLSTQSWVDRAEPLMKELSHDVQESCSAAILQDAEVVYVARMPAPHRIMSVTLAVGTRLPAFYTALGRVQLGFLAPDELTRRLGLRGPPPTEGAVADRKALIARIAADRAQGYAIVDEELERGLRSIAVPVLTRTGVNVGAINLSGHASRVSLSDLRSHFLPKLKAVVGAIAPTLA